MEELKKIIVNKNKYASFIAKEIKTICSTIGKRNPGSIGEFQALQYIEKYVKENCKVDETFIESFSLHPHSFLGWIWITISCVLIGMIMFFISPIISVIVTVLGLVAMFSQVFFYKKLIDFLFKKETSHNLTVLKKAKVETKARIFFNGHVDAAWNWPINEKYGGKVYSFLGYTAILVAIVSLLINIIAFIVLLSKNVFFVDSLSFIYLKELYGVVLYFGLGILLFIPLLVFEMLYMWEPNKIVDGANDNLSGCYIGIAILKALYDEKIDFDYLDIGLIITGSEEAGLRGAKAWSEKHANDYKDVPTYIISYDTIHEDEFLGVNYKDLNGLISSDKELSDCFIESSVELGIPTIKTSIPIFGGATDNAEFRKAGYKSTLVTALDHNLKDYYHTMNDTYSNLNMNCIANCFAISVKCLEKIAKKTKIQ